MKNTNLLEWCAHYIRARDAIERKLKSLDEKEDCLIAHYKDRDVTFFGEEVLSKKNVGKDEHITIVTLQTTANFETLVKEFSAFAINPKLTVIFVNPKTNEKWLLKPAIHASVADKTSLRLGLQSMFDTVQTI